MKKVTVCWPNGAEELYEVGESDVEAIFYSSTPGELFLRVTTTTGQIIFKGIPFVIRVEGERQ